MINKAIIKLASIASLAFAFAVVAITSPTVTYAAYNWDFSSSSAESQALTTELGAQGLQIFLFGIGVLLGVALVMMGAGWVFGRFKKFTGMGKKL